MNGIWRIGVVIRQIQPRSFLQDLPLDCYFYHCYNTRIDRIEHNMTYYALITYPGSGKQHLMSTPVAAVAAEPSNRYLLKVMGDRLLKENVISSYQIMVTDDDEISNVKNKELL